MTHNGHNYTKNHKLNNVDKDNTTKENVNKMENNICNYCCKMLYETRLNFIVHQNQCKDADHSNSPITVRWMKKKPINRNSAIAQEEQEHIRFMNHRKELAEKKKQRNSMYERPSTR
jgi:hypothetical protein